jgi:hypothetical protein
MLRDKKLIDTDLKLSKPRTRYLAQWTGYFLLTFFINSHYCVSPMNVVFKLLWEILAYTDKKRKILFNKTQLGGTER